MKILKDIKKTIDSANINFLIGSGLSFPFLDILNNIEIKLVKAEENYIPQEISELKKEYFEKSMVGNLKIIDKKVDKEKNEVLNNYENFYKIINHIVLKRENSILTKQINVFTTNIDIFSEKALENTGIEFDDGFHGKFNPRYDIGNFKKSYFKKSLHYENTSEIPVFNILKLHGSLSWKKEGKVIYLDHVLSTVRETEDKKNSPEFEEIYKKLMIINPTKQKFDNTIFDEYYYDLLRIYSNELEKENSVLFVMGFSFADEHIYKLTLRVADSNPTLKIYIFSHKSSSSKIYENIEKNAKNKNIEIVSPEEGMEYDFKTLNTEIFEKIIPFKRELVDGVLE
ncbi:MAG: SIR2 family protein [Mariniphaga sp.]|nr:SIR2 family protein [Mariniphaga sp.]